jgi:hypothetical protein
VDSPLDDVRANRELSIPEIAYAERHL